MCEEDLKVQQTLQYDWREELKRFPEAEESVRARESLTFEVIDSSKSTTSGKALSKAVGSSVRLPSLQVGDSADESDSIAVTAESNTLKAYRIAETASVKLSTEAGKGSGFFVSGDGFIVTADHVVPSSKRLQVVELSDGRTVLSTVVGRDPKNDLALLKVLPEEGKKFPALSLRAGGVGAGEEIASTGHPHGWSRLYMSIGPSQGIVGESDRKESYEHWPDAKKLLTSRAHVEPGSSGGAVVDVEGYAVGVVVGSTKNHDRTVIVPIETLLPILSNHKVIPELKLEKVASGSGPNRVGLKNYYDLPHEGLGRSFGGSIDQLSSGSGSFEFKSGAGAGSRLPGGALKIPDSALGRDSSSEILRNFPDLADFPSGKRKSAGDKAKN